MKQQQDSLPGSEREDLRRQIKELRRQVRRLQLEQDELKRAYEILKEGHSIDPHLQAGPKGLEGLQRVHLTPRQLEVLGLICQGMTNRQIADKLDIIEATAKAHVSAIFKELGVVSRTQALLAAQRLGLQDTSA